VHNDISHLPVLLVKRLNMPNSSVKVPPPSVDVIWSNIQSVSLSAVKFKTVYVHLRTNGKLGKVGRLVFVTKKMNGN